MRAAVIIAASLAACASNEPQVPPGDQCPPEARNDVVLQVELLPRAPMDGRTIREVGRAAITRVSGGVEIELGVLRIDLLAPDVALPSEAEVVLEHSGARFALSTTVRVQGDDPAIPRLVAWNLTAREPPADLPLDLVYQGDGCASEDACGDQRSASLTSTITGARVPAGSEAVIDGLRVVNGLSLFAVHGTECLDVPGATARGMITAP